MPLSKAGRQGRPLELLACGLGLLLSVTAPGCGDDARLRYAEDTARLSSAAITEVETSGGEDPVLEPLIGRAQVRLGEVERSIVHWRDHSGPLAYVTHAPCLRSALIALREALVAAHRPVPRDLDSAEAMLSEVASHDCAP